MIVTKPTWTRRIKQHHVVWWHEWHDVPWTEHAHVQTGNVICQDYVPNEYRAVVYTFGVRTEIGTFDSLTAAQEACDVLCAERLGCSLAEATANWRTWTKGQRATAKATRELRQRESATLIRKAGG